MMAGTPPDRCPRCDYTDVGYIEDFRDGGIMVACGACEARWVEIYEYLCIETSGTKPCSVCRNPTWPVDLSEEHKMCPDCFRNYEQ